MINAIGAISPGGPPAVDLGLGAASPSEILGSAASRAGGGESFATVLGHIAGGVAQSLEAGEQAASAGILGTGSVQATVEGVMAAEQSLQIGIGIRDRIVNAYLELSRMAI